MWSSSISNPACSAMRAAATNWSRTMSMSPRSIALGTWLWRWYGSAEAEMSSQLPVVGRAVLGRVLAHGRDDDPVRQQHLAQAERREHGWGRLGRRHRDAALPLGLGGEPTVDRGHEARVAELQVVVGHAQAPRQEAHGELDRLETA